jgi:hypothetical protein
VVLEVSFANRLRSLCKRTGLSGRTPWQCIVPARLRAKRSGAAAFILVTLRAKAGGAEGVRTPDLLNAIQALYQLSYDPIRKPRNLKSPPPLSNFLPPFADYD